MTRDLAIIWAALLWSMSSPALAQDTTTSTTATPASKTDNSIDVESDRMEVSDENKTSIFTGKVVAKRPDMTLNSDKLIVNYVDAKQPDGSSKTEVSDFNASGHVVIVTNKQKVTGESAKLNYKTNDLVVNGNVTVTQGATVLRGPKLEANLNTNQMVMTGGRVRGSFVPK
jgi:lipopolysaccharide export system protein LptA